MDWEIDDTGEPNVTILSVPDYLYGPSGCDDATCLYYEAWRASEAECSATAERLAEIECQLTELRRHT